MVEILPGPGYHPSWFGKRVFVAYKGTLSTSKLLRFQYIREDGSECYLALSESAVKYIQTEEQIAEYILGEGYFA